MSQLRVHAVRLQELTFNLQCSDRRILAPSRQILVFPLLVGLRHSAGLQETERCVVVPLGTRVIPIQGARQTLAHSHHVEPTLFVRGMVTELSAAVLMATQETHLCGAMLTPALRAPVAQMLTVNQMATELCASAGRDMRVTPL